MSPAAVEILSGREDIDLVRLEYAAPESDNFDEMQRAHGYQTHPRTELKEPWFGNAALLARCPNILAISSTGAGYDMIDVDDCTAAGVIVVNQSGTNKEGVAEHALGLILSLSKKIAVSEKAMRTVANMDRRFYEGNDIRGKTIGIVGIGNIGTRVAELCRGLFQMKVLAYDPYLTAEQITARGGIKTDLPDLLRQSDYVTVHCPRTKESFGLLGVEQFALMKPSAYFINTARGGIHDEPALAAAVSQGKIAGAGLDVFLQEPPDLDHPLLHIDNIIVTPHNAGLTTESVHEMVTATARQWIDIFHGKAPPRLVNPEAWPLYSERFTRLLGFAPAPAPLP
ncbi:MAG: 3-phosphoglycerate dehydrogenase [Acetobacteraceae bacterium]|nr:3-phosphoglycerate dehydrogenase [Acetobacteraceae bacterium]